MHQPEREAEVWDVSFFAIAERPPPAASMPSGGQGDPLGSLEEVRRTISESLSGVDWSDPIRGTYLGKTFRLEFLLDPEEPCRQLTARVHGRGKAIKVLLELALAAHWHLWLNSHGQWLHELPEEDLLALIPIDLDEFTPPWPYR